MRVAMVCPYSLSAPGGVQAQVLGLAGALERVGCDVTVIGPCDGRPPSVGVTTAGITTVAVTTVGRTFGFAVNGSVARMAPHPAAAARTVQALRRGRFDVVHLHEPLAPSITIAALLARPAPLLGTFHAAGDRTPYRWLAGPSAWLARRLDARVTVSDEARRLAQRSLGGEYEVLWNGVDVDPVASPAKHDTNTRAVLFLGRHEPRKGLDVLLAALGSLPDDVELWIGGEGPDTARLRARCRQDRRVVWLGRISDAEKAVRLRSAAALCVPSLRGESFGVVLLEAMTSGTPVVASDLAAYRAVARHDRDALLVPPGGAAGLASALRRVLDEPGLADRLRTEGMQRCRSFDMDALASRYLGIYQRLATGPAQREPATWPPVQSSCTGASGTAP